MKIILKNKFVTIYITSFVFLQQSNFAFSQTEEAKTKVVLIGIGGATLKVILPLIEESRLPNFKLLIDKGIWGELFVPDANLSSMTSLVTGVKKEKHGIIEYCEKLSGKYIAPFAPSCQRKVKAIWNIATDYNRRIGVVNWWATCPAEKINGFVISNAFIYSAISSNNSPHIFKGYPLVYPESMLNSLQKFTITDSEIELELNKLLDYKYKFSKRAFKNFRPDKRFYLDTNYCSDQFKEMRFLVALVF